MQLCHFTFNNGRIRVSYISLIHSSIVKLLYKEAYCVYVLNPKRTVSLRFYLNKDPDEIHMPYCQPKRYWLTGERTSAGKKQDVIVDWGSVPPKLSGWDGNLKFLTFLPESFPASDFCQHEWLNYFPTLTLPGEPARTIFALSISWVNNSEVMNGVQRQGLGAGKGSSPRWTEQTTQAFLSPSGFALEVLRGHAGIFFFGNNVSSFWEMI